MEKRPLVAFCIPTYNRAEYLRDSLESYVKNKDFDEDIEIVISDNASTDNTQSVGEYYASKYPNVHYFRNEENIRDANFPLALDRATAYYAKLANDNLPVSEDGLWYIKNKVRKYLGKDIAIFFVEGGCLNYRGKEDEVLCEEFEDLILHLSRNVTWIALFGAWKDQWSMVKDRTKYSELMLSQDDWFYQIMEISGTAVLMNGKCHAKKRILNRKSGYNWFRVQVENYYRIMQPYIAKGLISSKVQKKEKETFLLEVMPWIAKRYWLPMYPEWDFDYSGTTRILWTHFKRIPLFYLIMATIPLWANWCLIKYYHLKLLNKTSYE